jgi:hypothetical protein
MASRWLKLWTASAFAVALLSGLGCQARHHHSGPTLAATQQSKAVVHPGYARPDYAKIRSPRVFRGSVSSVLNENDIISVSR